MASKKFQVIVCDPPWDFSDRLTMSDVKRGATANYNTLSTQELCQLPIQNITDPSGAILALWIPGSLLEDGIKVMSAWGFQQKQIYVWVKTKNDPLKKIVSTAAKEMVSVSKNPGIKTIRQSLKSITESFEMSDILSFYMGRLFRQTHEIALIGINNTGIYEKLKNRSQRSVCFGENLKHSAKPEALQDSLEEMFSECRKAELFARRQRPDWICLGNEIDGLDIREALTKLA